MSKNTIYRQDAVDAINELHDKPNAWLDLAVEALEKLPSAESERAIKDCRNCKHGNYNDHWDTYFCYHSGDCNAWDKWEPSARPERKTGEWIANGDIPKECPFCGEDWDKYVFGDVVYTGELPKFCPSCGEDMRGDSDDN